MSRGEKRSRTLPEPPVDLGRRNFIKRFIPLAGPALDHSLNPAQWSKETKQGVAMQIAVLGVAFGGLSVLLNDEGQKYDGPVSTMKGKEVISDTKLTEMMDAVESTGDPFLTKLSMQFKALHGTNHKPSEFPEWISEESFPLIVTRDQRDISTAAMDFITGKEATRFIFRNLRENHENTLLEIEPIKIGITLGDPEAFSKQEGALGQGMVICKEAMSHLMGISTSMDIYDFFTSNNVATFTELDGKAITDRDRQLRVGAATFYLTLTNQESSVWKSIDGLPIFMIGSSVLDLAEQGRLPLSIQSNLDNQLYIAAAMLSNNPTFRADIIKLK
ncbi:MAG: hypothetical protein ABIO02_02030, partial [Patescibacteria group bacterium]